MTISPTSSPPPARPRPRLAVPGRHVVGMVARLAPDSGPTAASVSACAQLRRGLGREPGSVPEIWPWTVDGLTNDETSDRVTAEEAAVHHALTLFAFHQQGKSARMHDPDRTFGAAVRWLADRGRGERPIHETPVYRRFSALTTAGSVGEVSVHGRGLVGQLKAEGLGFDYARFADDLFYLGLPGRAAAVRRRWSRAFFARQLAAEDPSLDIQPIDQTPVEGD